MMMRNVFLVVGMALGLGGCTSGMIQDLQTPDDKVGHVRLINSEGKTLQKWTIRGGAYKYTKGSPLWEFTTIDGRRVSVTPTQGTTLIEE